jgi:hypothetical protein
MRSKGELVIKNSIDEDNENDEGVPKSDLPPTDFEHLEDSIRAKLIVEIFHNMGCINNKVYYTKYDGNAEAFDRDYKIWKKLEKQKGPKKGKNVKSTGIPKI